MNIKNQQILFQYLQKVAHDTWYSRHKEQAKRARAMWYMMHREQALKKAKKYRNLVNSGILHPQKRVNMGGSLVTIGFK